MKNIVSVLIATIVAISLNFDLAFAASGYASFYKKGRLTANGERFLPMGFTCAHRHLPFGTKLRVTNLRNGRSVTVRVNDRGPFIRGRVLDLSLGAARAIGMGGAGVVKVSYVIVH